MVLFFLADSDCKYAAEVSILPPIADLEDRLLFYKDKIGRDIEDLEVNPNFEDGAESLYRDSNTFALVALALGMSTENSEYKKMVLPLIKAAQLIGAVKDLEGAKSSVANLEKVFSEKMTGEVPESWIKVAHLAPVMKKSLPSLSTEIKRLTRSEKTFKRSSNTAKVIGASTTLTAIATGCRSNVDETLAPQETKLWLEYCDRLYQSAFDLNQKAHGVKEGTVSFEELSKAFDTLDATCNTTCHEKFGGTTN